MVHSAATTTTISRCHGHIDSSSRVSPLFVCRSDPDSSLCVSPPNQDRIIEVLAPPRSKGTTPPLHTEHSTTLIFITSFLIRRSPLPVSLLAVLLLPCTLIVSIQSSRCICTKPRGTLGHDATMPLYRPMHSVRADVTEGRYGFSATFGNS